jgi:predicted secreted protein
MKLAAWCGVRRAARVWQDAWPGILLGLLVTLSVVALAAEPEDEKTVLCASQQQDPLDSPLWDYLRQRFMGAAPYRFDDRIRVRVPPFAEDPFQVPISIDASALAGRIERIVVWADFNPIQHVVTAWPQSDSVRPQLSLRIKVEQGTPVRAAVLTHGGVWHVGGQYLDASGGGCTAPSMAASDPYWESHLGEIQARGVHRAPGRCRPLQVSRYSSHGYGPGERYSGVLYRTGRIAGRGRQGADAP